METKWIFNSASFFNKTLKQKGIIKTNLNLMEFFQEITQLKNKGWSRRNKP